jgi:two-component system CheB/CheR fusion protein
MAKKKTAQEKDQKSTSTGKRRRRGSQEDTSPASESDIGLPGNRFPIIGVGASAGGLDALKHLCDAMPDEPGFALVIVQHLDPTRPSLTSELLATHTRMRVTQATDEVPVEVDHIYVIPPDKNLSISGGALRLTVPDRPRGGRTPIDFFLRSLADDQQQRAVGVILSGTGTDGTLGVKAIKAAGGLVLAQEPETAAYGGMPRSAIASGVVDYVLPVSRMPEVLQQYAQHPYIHESGEEEETPGAALKQPEQEQPQTGRPENLNDILALLRTRAKQDFRAYKDNTLIRRTRRRMCLQHMDDYDEYLDYLRTHPDEVDALVKDLLISVTDFFRDRDAWDDLREQAIVSLFEGKVDDEPVRVWVPGCATGEEPYSVAILLLEELHEAKKTCPLQIFASDIDTAALEFARNGRYPASIAADVSAERLKRFFVKEDGDQHYLVNKTLRENIVFADQNVIADPPFSKLDLICCRNLLIYLKPEIQEKLIALFHFALREGGYLFLGSSETTGRQRDLFETLSKRWRIYRRIGPTQHNKVEIPIATTTPHRELGIPAATSAEHREIYVEHLAQRRMLDWLSPSAVLIDTNWKILYISGNIDAYVTRKAGVPTDDLLANCRQGLRTKLRAAVHKVLENKQTVEVNARVHREGQYHPVRLIVQPAPDRELDQQLILVMFDETGTRSDGEQEGFAPSDRTPARKSGTAPEETTDLDEDSVIRQLEDELAATREDLQTTIEQLETSNEEYKAANEEVMSMNEEFQSTNEELETSKEELQSLNEELSTVNNQLTSKVEELETKHADLENLIAVNDVATICLDTNLAVRWFTPAAQRVIRVKSADAGRSLSDFSHDFIEDDLLPVAQRVLKTLTPVEDEVEGRDGSTFIRRIAPYRAGEHGIGGVVMTFIDITARKKIEAELQQLNADLEARVAERAREIRLLAKAVSNLGEGVIITGDELDWPGPQIVFVNEAICEITGYSAEELLGQTPRILQGDETASEALERLKTELSANRSCRVELVNYRKDGTPYDAELFITPLFDDEGARTHFVSVHRDVSQRKQAEQSLRQSEERTRAILNTATDAIITINGQGIINTVNPATERMFGYTADELIGRNVSRLMPPPYCDEHDDYIKRYLETGEAKIIGVGRELTGLRKDGSTFPVDLAVSEVTERGMFTGIIRDVTERHADRQRLIDSERLAVLGEAMAGLAHESRNALGRSNANLNQLRRRLKGQDELLEFIERALHANTDIQRQFEEVREYAAPIQPRRKRIRVSDVIREAWADLTDDERARQTTMRLTTMDDPAVCEADPFMLRNVFRNLMENSIAACEDNVQIDVAVSQSQIDSSPAFEISIRDNGPGLPPETKEHAFDAFFTTKTKGTGLGLAIVKRIVEAHGGHVTFGTSDRPGAEIVVTLPQHSTPQNSPSQNS